jgi:hypothetical protein
MVNRTNINIASNLTSYPHQFTNRTSTIPAKYGSQFLKDKQFFLTEFQQQILLGAYSFGYLLTLTPGISAAYDLISEMFCIVLSNLQLVGYQ